MELPRAQSLPVLLPALSAVPAHRRRWRIVCLVIKEVGEGRGLGKSYQGGRPPSRLL